MCENACSMPPCSNLKPRWHPPPRHQMRNSWRASGSILYVKSNTLCRQFAILLPNDYNLLNFPLPKDFSDSYTFWSSCSVFSYLALSSYEPKTKNQDRKRRQLFYLVCLVGMSKCACVSHFACTGRVNIACIKICVCVARVNHVTLKHKLTQLEQIKVIEHYKLKQILSLTVIRTRHFSYVHRKGVQLTYVLSRQHWSRGDPHLKLKHVSEPTFRPIS